MIRQRYADARRAAPQLAAASLTFPATEEVKIIARHDHSENEKIWEVGIAVRGSVCNGQCNRSVKDLDNALFLYYYVAQIDLDFLSTRDQQVFGN